MKRWLCGILVALLLLCGGCVGEGQETSLYQNLSNFVSEFEVRAEDINQAFAEVFAEHPELQVYLGKVSIQSAKTRHIVEVEYQNQSIDPSSIVCGSGEKAMRKGVLATLEAVEKRGVVVLQSQKEQPDPHTFMDTLREKEYLAVMGLSTSEWSFVTNDFTSDMVVLYDFSYDQMASQLLENRNKTRAEVERLSAELWTEDTDPQSRVRAIHDYLVQYTEYAELEEVDDHTAYNVLVNGRGVCDGYTYAAHLLLKAAGIESMVALGMATGEEHAWNVVKLDGNYYHMDVTWDDPVGAGEQMTVYDYYLVGDATLQKDHTWEGDIPACPSDYKQ
ncbi:MAG: hypothetical protein IKY33_03590 [Clostridia bacterium]|nr:hypothetical protein [Clostridia bacterium]